MSTSTTAGYMHEPRDDLRCTLCRQRDAFHCEHDTPYRDIYLGIFDPKLPRNIVINTERSKPRTQNDSSRTGGTHMTGKQQQTKLPPPIYMKPMTNKVEEHKQQKKGGCTIL